MNPSASVESFRQRNIRDNQLAPLDALERAQDTNAGLDALAILLMTIPHRDLPNGEDIGTLLRSVQRDMEVYLWNIGIALRRQEQSPSQE